MAMVDSGKGRRSDPVIQVLDDVSQAVAENLEDERLLLGELERARAERAAGAPMRQVLGDGRPRAVVLAGRVASRITRAGARLQQGLTHSLAREGESVTGIARRFEVSHQRVSTILRHARSSDDESGTTGEVSHSQ